MAKVEPFKNIDSLWGNISCGETCGEEALREEEEMFEFTDGTLGEEIPKISQDLVKTPETNEKNT